MTVRHLVAERLVDTVVDGNFHICINPDCQVVYYGPQLFLQPDLRTTVWLKRDADPKYICYCNQVTEEQIVTAMQQQGARSLGDVVKLTGAMRNGRCLLKNPTGECCGATIKQLIEATLRSESCLQPKRC